MKKIDHFTEFSAQLKNNELDILASLLFSETTHEISLLISLKSKKIALQQEIQTNEKN